MVAESFRETHKKRIALCYPSCVERKTRLEPAFAGISRELMFTPPTPERGDLGSLCASHRFRQCKMKKDSLKLSSPF